MTYQTKIANINNEQGITLTKEKDVYIPTTAYEVTYTTKSRKGNVSTHTIRLLNNYFWDFFLPAPIEDLAQYVQDAFKGHLVKARRVSVIWTLIKGDK